MSFFGGQVHGLLGHNLLTLAQRDVVEVLVVARETQLFAEGLHVLQWVDTGGQDEEDRRARSRLLIGLGELHATVLSELGPHLLLNEVTKKIKSILVPHI